MGTRSVSEYALMMEDALDAILEELDGLGDDDVVSTILVLEAALEQIRGFKKPRPEIIAGLERLIASEPTAGEVRKLIRDARNEIAASA